MTDIDPSIITHRLQLDPNFTQINKKEKVCSGTQHNNRGGSTKTVEEWSDQKGSLAEMTFERGGHQIEE